MLTNASITIFNQYPERMERRVSLYSPPHRKGVATYKAEDRSRRRRFKKCR